MCRTDIFGALSAILQFPQVVTQKNSQRAIGLFGQNPKLDYVDCLLLAWSKENDIFTLDKELQAMIKSS